MAVLLVSSRLCMTAPNRDRFRELPIRLLGYANEVGEAFRPLVPRAAVNASYATASAYVLTDTAWRASTLPGESGVTQAVAVEACDTLLWQTLASVLIPGAAINRVVWAVGRAGPKSAWLPTAVGLGCIPLIVDPIDRGVEAMMDLLVRPLYPSRGRHSD